jgi:quinol monooxygenase YgiN
VSHVLYEVTLRVERAIAGDYRAWLHDHVRGMLTLPGFLDARMSEVADPATDDDATVFCCHYRLQDAAALDAYLRDHAPRMRAEGVERFGARFSAQRRVMTVLADY